MTILTVMAYVFVTTIAILVLIFAIASIGNGFYQRRTYGCIQVIVDEDGNYKDAALIPYISSEDVAKVKNDSYLGVMVRIFKEGKDYFKERKDY